MNKKYDGIDDLKLAVITLLVGIAVIILVIFSHNACSADIWNDGICPKCETRYELRGVSNGFKYYVCPDCGQDVQRY